MRRYRRQLQRTPLRQRRRLRRCINLCSALFHAKAVAMKISTDCAGRFSTVVFCIWMAAAWSIWPTLQAGAPAAETATAPAGDSLNAAADRLDQVINNLKEADKEIPRDTFEPAAAILPIGADPDLMLKWIKTNTRWVPYQGVLRGAQGVLMDRMGNSLDRALLMGFMLEAARKPVRLAHCQLSEDQGKKTLADFASANAKPAFQPAAQTDEAAIAEYARAHQMDPAQLKRDMAKFTLPVDQLSDSVAENVAEQAPVILADAGKAAGGDSTNELDAIRDHWWV